MRHEEVRNGLASLGKVYVKISKGRSAALVLAGSLLLSLPAAAGTLQVAQDLVPASTQVAFTNLPSNASATASTVLTGSQTLTGNGGYTNRSYTGSYSSYLSFGRMGLSESIGFSCPSNCGNESYGFGLTAGSSDTLTFNSAAVGNRLRIQYLFEGSLTETLPDQYYLNIAEANFGVGLGGTLTVGTTMGQGTGGTAGFTGTSGGTVTPDPTLLNTWDFYGTGYSYVGITSTQLFQFGQSIFGEVVCNDLFNGTSCSEGMSFMNTSLIGNAVVVDANGNPVPGATFTSASGYDYTQALQTAPEPAAVTLALGGLALVLAVRRKS